MKADSRTVFWPGFVRSASCPIVATVCSLLPRHTGSSPARSPGGVRAASVRHRRYSEGRCSYVSRVWVSVDLLPVLISLRDRLRSRSSGRGSRLCFLKPSQPTALPPAARARPRPPPSLPTRGLSVFFILAPPVGVSWVSCCGF